MSTDVDRRVLEMRFDNEQFKRETSNTLTLLQKLKAALHFSSADDGLRELNASAKSLSDDGLLSVSKSVEALEKRFSTFGIMSMRIVENVTDSLYGLATKGINYVMNAIKQGGVRRAFNIENAHFQLQALLKDEVEVQKIMQQANDSVTDTAYAYDEAASAAAQFAASGIKAGRQMETALKGIVGVTAMTNSEYESISRIFNTVAGNGRLMGDQLLQLSSRGLNAAATIADYFQEVRGEANMTEAAIREMVSKGQISFEIFSESMAWAFGDSAKRANETFNGAISNLKSAFSRIGAGFVSPLIEQNSAVVNTINVLRTKVNELKSALVFDSSIGNVHALSKQFTDSVLKMSTALGNWLSKLDLKDTITIAYYGLESIKNVFKGMYSVIKPVGQAFKEIFFSGATSNIKNIAKSIRDFTSTLKLSEKTSSNIRDTFKGLFGIVRLLGSAFIQLVKAVVPVSSPIGGLIDTVAELTGFLGRCVTAVVDFIDENGILVTAFGILGSAIKAVIAIIMGLASGLYELGEALYSIPEVQEVLNSIAGVFIYLGTTVASYIERFVDKVQSFSSEVENMADSVRNSKLGVIAGLFGLLYQNLKALAHDLGLDKALKSVKEFVYGIATSLKETSVTEKIQKFKDVMTSFGEWAKNTFAPLFKGFSFSNIISGAISVGLVQGLLKMSRALANLVNPLKSITGVLNAYSENLRADALIKNAKAIAILAGALAILSLVDTEKLVLATTALAGFTYIMMQVTNGFQMLIPAIQSINNIQNKLAKALNNFTNAIKWNQISKAIKAFSISFAIIVGSILVMAIAVNKDETAVQKGLLTIAAVLLTLATFAAMISKVAKDLNNAKGMALVSLSIASVVGSLAVAIFAVSSLLKMKIPDDWMTKMSILGELFIGLAAITLVVGYASGLTGGNSLGKNYKNIIGVAVALGLIVKSLGTLFKLDLPMDYRARMGILTAVFAELGALITVLGIVTSICENGKIRGSSIILSMVFYIWTIVGALSVLSMFPLTKLLGGMLALTVLMGALSRAIYAAGTASETANGSYKNIVALGLVIGVLTTALTVLSIVDWKKLIPASISLGIVLAALGGALYGLGKVRATAKNLITFGSMVIILAELAGALVILSGQPWESILASGIAMGIVLTSFASLLKTLSGASGLKKEKMDEFLRASLSLFEIAGALALLSFQPWNSILASGIAMGLVIESFATLLKTLSASSGIKKEKVNEFLKAALSLFEIALALRIVSDQPWDSLLAGATGISELLLAMTGAFKILSTISESGLSNVFMSMDALLLFGVKLTALLAVLSLVAGILEKIGIGGTIRSGIDLLCDMFAGLGKMIGSIISGFGEGLTGRLPAIGKNLSDFAQEASLFFETMNNLGNGTAQNMIDVSKALLSFTTSGFLDGIQSFLSKLNPFRTAVSSAGEQESPLATFAKEMSAASAYLKEYSDAVSDISVSAITDSEQAWDSLVRISALTNILNGSSISGGSAGALKQFSEDLMLAAPNLVGYSLMVSKVNQDAINGSVAIITILSEMAKSLPSTTGALTSLFTKKYTLKDFAADLYILGKSLGEYGTFIEGLDATKTKVVSDHLNDLMELCFNLQQSKVTGKELVEFAVVLSSISDQGLTQFINNFGQRAPEATSAIGNFLEQALATIQNSQEDFEIEGTNNANAYSSALIFAFDQNQKTMSEHMGYIGRMAVAGLEGGITDSSAVASLQKATSVVAQVVDDTIANTLQIHSPSWVTYLKGIFVDQGLANGITDGKASVAMATEDVTNAVRERLEILLSDMSSYGLIIDNVFAGVAATFGSASEELFGRTKELERAHELVDASTRNLTEAEIRGGFRLQQLDDAYVLDQMKRIKDEGIASIIREGQGYESEVYDWNVIPDLDQMEFDLSEYDGLLGDALSSSAGASAAKEKIFEDDIDSEQSYWSDLLRIRREGVDAEKYQEMTLLDFKKEVAEDTWELLDSYLDRYNSARDSLLNEMNLFDEIKERESVSKDDLIKNLKDQIAVHEEYNNTLESLNERLGTSELGEYLRTLGTDSLEELKAINSMTDDELSQYSDLYIEKISTAGEGARLQLKEEEQLIAAEIANILGVMESSIDLWDMASFFDGKFEDLDQYMSQMVLPMENAMRQAELIFEQTAGNFTDAFANGLDPEEFKIAIRDSILTSQDFGKEEGATIGENITAGVAEGINADNGSIVESSNAVIDTVEDAMLKAADIHSPSRRFQTNVGEYITEGVAVGITDDLQNIALSANTVIDAVEETFLDRYTTLINTVIFLVQGMLAAIEELYPDIEDTGEESADRYLNGLKSKHKDLEDEGNAFASIVLQGISTAVIDFYVLGQNAGQGFVSGLKSTLSDVSSVSGEIGNVTVKSTMKSLDEHSPSKRMGQVAYYAGVGYLDVLRGFIGKVESAGEEIGDATVNSVQNTLGGINQSLLEDLNIGKSFTPMFDTEVASASLKGYAKIFSDAVSVSKNTAETIADGFRSSNYAQNNKTEDSSSGSKVVTVTMHQNNYSPKALERIDIYRDSRNLLSRAREAINRA